MVNSKILKINKMSIYDLCSFESIILLEDTGRQNQVILKSRCLRFY